MDKKLFMLIYGRAKTGKTTLVDTAPGPRLLLDAESGSNYLDSEQIIWNINGGEECPTDVDDDTTVVVYVHDYKTVEKVYEILDEGTHPFNSVILDSISEIQQRCIDELFGTDPLRIQDWGEVRRQVTNKLRIFRDLTMHMKKRVNVFATATAFENQEVDGEKRITPYLQGSAAQALPFLFDIVTYLYITTDKDSGEEVRVLQCKSNHKLDTGDRTGFLPDGLENPDIENIIGIIDKGLEKKKAARKARKQKEVSNG